MKKIETVALLTALIVIGQVRVYAWENGDTESSAMNPSYGTHDWIAAHALNMLPAKHKDFLNKYLKLYLYGTEFPDRSAASWGGISGYGDKATHHIYFFDNGTLKEDAAGKRATEEYGKALTAYSDKNYNACAVYLGCIAHYIGDMGVYAHTISGEKHHDQYEAYVEIRTLDYSGGVFEKYLGYSYEIHGMDPDNASLILARISRFGGGKVKDAWWMDDNYDWSNQTFRDSAGNSLNDTVVYLALTLEGFFERVEVKESTPPQPQPASNPIDEFISGIIDAIKALINQILSLFSQVVSIYQRWLRRDIQRKV